MITYGKPTVKTSVPLQYRPLKTITRQLFVTSKTSFKFTEYRLKRTDVSQSYSHSLIHYKKKTLQNRLSLRSKNTWQLEGSSIQGELPTFLRITLPVPSKT